MRALYRKHQLFFLILLTAAIGFLVWYFSNIVMFIIAAGVISIIGTPMVEFFDRLRIRRFAFPHTLSVIITLLAIIILFTGTFTLFIPMIVSEVQMINSIDPQALSDYFRHDILAVQSFLLEQGIMPRGATIESLLRDSIKHFLDLSLFSNILTSLISVTGTFFFNLFSILFLSFFFLKDNKMLPRLILLLSPDDYTDSMKKVMYKSRNLLSRYFIGLLIQIALNILTYSLALYIAGVRNPLVIGFFSGILIIIPYIGGIISLILGILMGVTGVISAGEYQMILPMVIKIAVAMSITQIIDNNLFAPIIQGKSMKAHPVEIFLVVIAAGSFGGIIGMIAAVPAYGFVKIVAGEFLTNFRLVRRFSEKS